MRLSPFRYFLPLRIRSLHLLIALVCSGCSTTPPTVTTKPTEPNLASVMAASQTLLTEAESVVENAAICKQIALQAAQNAFAVEKESKDELIAALKEGSLELIQSCSDEVDVTSAELRDAVQQSSKVIQLEAAARTAIETAQRKFKLATRQEDAGQARADFALADAAAREAMDRGRAASALSAALKEKWLVIKPNATAPTPTTDSVIAPAP